MIIELATKRNIDDWMILAGKVKDGFPGFEKQEILEEHRKTVLDFMDKSSAGVKIVQYLHKTDYHNQEFVIEDIDGRWIYFGSKE